MTQPTFHVAIKSLPEPRSFSITRVYPRLTVGGAESDILALLAGVGDTQMIVTEEEGPAALVAKRRAAHYERLQAPRFENLCKAMRSSALVHLHTINDHPLAPLAAQLSGCQSIVQTVHNDFDCESSHFVDHSIVVAPQTRWRLAAPNRSTCISSGIDVPPAPLPRLSAQARPLRLLEIRRPDKPMHLTLEQILATGALDDIDWQATIVGMAGPSGDPRITRVGAVADATPYLAAADVLVHASATETFGRVVFEAMAQGALVAATALPPFVHAAAEGAVLHLFCDLSPQGMATELRGLLKQTTSESDWARTRQRNHAYVQSRHGTDLMLARTRQVYGSVQHQRACGRNFLPEDATDGDFSLFAATVDALLQRQQPPPIHAGVLSPRQQAALLWIAARYRVLRQSLALPTLQHVAKVLGPRHLLALDVAKHQVAAHDLPGALHALDQAVELDPEKVSPYLSAIAIHVATSNLALAKRWMQRLEEKWPEHPVLPAVRERVKTAT